MKVKIEIEIETAKDFDFDVINKIGHEIRTQIEPYEFVGFGVTLTSLDRAFKEVKAE